MFEGRVDVVNCDERERGCMRFPFALQARRKNGSQQQGTDATPRASSRHVLPDWRTQRRSQAIPSPFVVASLGKWKQNQNELFLSCQ
uniref:Uncharacterized protein n=1 Tax=Salix viminalis TaxID=40686 RepID=A0A6N2L792_SALVM